MDTYTPQDLSVILHFTCSCFLRTGPPGRPEPVAVLNVTSRSVALQWTVPRKTGGAEITGMAGSESDQLPRHNICFIQYTGFTPDDIRRNSDVHRW